MVASTSVFGISRVRRSDTQAAARRPTSRTLPATAGAGPTNTRASSGELPCLREVRVHRVEAVADLAADGLDGHDAEDGDEQDEHAVLEQGRALFFLDEVAGDGGEAVHAGSR